MARKHQSTHTISGSALATKNLWQVAGFAYPRCMDRVELPDLGVHEMT